MKTKSLEVIPTAEVSTIAKPSKAKPKNEGAGGKGNVLKAKAPSQQSKDNEAFSQDLAIALVDLGAVVTQQFSKSGNCIAYRFKGAMPDLLRNRGELKGARRKEATKAIDLVKQAGVFYSERMGSQTVQRFTITLWLKSGSGSVAIGALKTK